MGGLCGLEKPQPMKKGLSFALIEELNGAVGDHVIACTFAVAVEDEDLVGVGGAFIVGGENRQDAVGHGDAGVRDVHGLAGLRRVHGLDVAIEVGPCLVVVEAGVEELAAAQSRVAVFAEELRKRDPVGMQVAHAGAVAENLGGVGWMAGEERRTRRIAERELAVVAIEANALGSETVDIGAVRVEAAVVAGELGPHVVGHEEEDVETASAGLSCGGFGLRSCLTGCGKCGCQGGACCLGKKIPTRGCVTRGLIAVVRVAHSGDVPSHKECSTLFDESMSFSGRN